MAISHRTISIDDDVWNESKALIKETMNMTMSKFIEIQLRTLVRSHKSPFQQVVHEAMQDFMSGDKSLSESDRRKMQSLFDREKQIKKVKKKK